MYTSLAHLRNLCRAHIHVFGPLRNLLDPREEPLKDVVLDFMECRVLDASGVEAIDNLAERYRVAQKRLHLRHLSEDCRRLLKKGGDLVEVNIMEDPWCAPPLLRTK